MFFSSVVLPLQAQEDTLSFPRNTQVQEIVSYSAKDSIVSFPAEQLIQLYNEALVQFQGFTLEAGYITIDLTKNIVFSTALPDSSGNLTQYPVFKDALGEYSTDTILFNLNSKRGKIQHIRTQEGEGYLFGENIKKQADNSLHILKGKYTTCNLDTPHFFIEANTIKFTEDKKIISGPAQLVIEDVHTPLILPFGYFPFGQEKKVGLLMPSYSYTPSIGYSLDGLGFYMGISPYWDNSLLTDIYSSGSFRIRNTTNYRKLYGFTGKLDLGYSSIRNIFNERLSRDYSIQWQHRQDPKANPYSTFSANINLTSGEYFATNREPLNNQISSDFQSTVNYTRKILDNKALFTVTASHNLNRNGLKPVSMVLPEIGIKQLRISPFKNSKIKALKKVILRPTLDLKQTVNTFDSLMFTSQMWDSTRVGARYNTPLELPISLSGALTVTPNISLSGGITDRRLRSSLNTNGNIVSETSEGLYHYWDINSSVRMNFSPQITGIFRPKKGNIVGIKHLVLPSISYALPIYILDRNRYYDVFETQNQAVNQFGDGVYRYSGSPQINSQRRFGNVNLALNNRVDIKKKIQKKNGEWDTKKQTILRRFDLSTSYVLDSADRQWNDINFNLRSDLLNNLSFNMYGNTSLYGRANGELLNNFFWRTNSPIYFSSINGNIEYSFDGKSKKQDEIDRSTLSPEELRELEWIERYPERYRNLNIPFQCRVVLNASRIEDFSKNAEWNLTTNIQGNIALTKGWDIGFRTTYNILDNAFQFSEFNIVRDLHCWEIRFDWVPTGRFKTYAFQVNVKSSILQDLKLTKRRELTNYFL